MKIAIDVRNIGRQRTGSETVVVELTKRLIRDMPENVFYLLTDTNDPRVISSIGRALGCVDMSHVHITPLKSPHRLWWIFIAVQGFIRRNDVDVFHTEYIVPFFIPRNTRVLTHIHDVSFAVPGIRGMIARKDLMILDILIPRSLRRADAIIAVSSFTKQEIVKYYDVDASKIHIIYNAHQSQLVEGADSPSGISNAIPVDTASKYALPKKYIFALSTMQPRKNIPFLVRAFAEVAHRMPQMHLVLGGPRAHNFDEAIEDMLDDGALAAVRDRIHFTGYIDQGDLRDVYALSQCFVTPSLYEGFGVPILEAFEAGTPVVASDIPVYREVAGAGALYFSSWSDSRPSGEGGVMGKKESVDRCASCIYTICTDNDQRKVLAAAAKAQAEKFSWEISAEKFANIIAG